MLEKTYITEELAKELGVTGRTVEKWRRQGRGPRFFKDGKIVRYRESDIVAWMTGAIHDPVDKHAQADVDD